MSALPNPSTAPAGPETVLDTTGLNVSFKTDNGVVRVLTDVGFSLARGQVLGVLGESGSGKSVLLRTMLGILPGHARVEGSIRLAGREMAAASPAAWREQRGTTIAMVFQEPMTAFDPVFTIGRQITETIRRHEGVDQATASRRALELLELVSIPSAKSRLGNYPHQMSGGMRQRAMIALALACRPKILLADEPTTALDVTVQIQILLLLRRIQAEMDMSMIFVTHDIGVATEVSDNIGVMYAGRFVEKASAEDLIDGPRHPYTRRLLASTVHGQRKDVPLDMIPGAPPNLADMPPGCAFAPRCRDVEMPLCSAMPAEQPIFPAGAVPHTVRCFKAGADLATGAMAATR
jgi:peptide/nickel transport system ATP-binding protein